MNCYILITLWSHKYCYIVATDALVLNGDIYIVVVVTDRSTGRVGAPLTCNEVMLIDWEEGTMESPVCR